MGERIARVPWADRGAGEPAQPAYRPDIDGLRAVAVLLVVVFHVTGRIPGGFIGVDIFFVISGYLISSLIMGQLQQGRFSLAGFYERRIRRIFPALVLMLTGVSILAALVLFPSDFAAYAHSLRAAILSVSNFYFWRDQDYFGALDATKPLLHTWSLAVEEQYYLVFPVALAAIWKYARPWLTWIVAAAALASFTLSVIGVARDPSAAFYLPHTRTWELLLGVLVALGARPPLRSAISRNIASGLGAALIAGSTFLLTDQDPFPGFAAVPPCLGAALIIAAGASGPSLVGRALAQRPMVFIGLISYSLYLWHWPLIVLLQQRFAETDPSRTTKLVAVTASFAFATLSWRFVETPLRRRGANRARVFALAAASVAAVASAASVVIMTDGLPGRFSPATDHLASYLTYRKFHDDRRRCTVTSQASFDDYDQSACLRRTPGRPSMLIVGDSFAGHLWHGFDAVFTDRDLLEASAIGCKPTLTPIKGQERPECLRLMDFVFHRYLPQHPVDLLVLSANWQPDEIAHVEETLDWARARGIEVVLLGPGPQYDAPVPWLLAHARQLGRPGLVRDHQWSGPAHADALLSALARRKGVRYGSPYQALCDSGVCRTTLSDGTPLQFDFAHFTWPGSLFLAHRLRSSGALDLPRAAASEVR